MRRVLIFIGFLVYLSSCVEEPGLTVSPTPYLNESDWADSLLQQLSTEEKLGQLLLLQSDLSGVEASPRIQQWVNQGFLGGLLLENLELERFIDFTDSCKTNSALPLFLATNQEVLLNNQFSDVEQIPSYGAVRAIDTDSLQHELLALYTEQAHALGINLSFFNSTGIFNPSFNLKRDSFQITANARLRQMNAHRILPIVEATDFSTILSDSTIDRSEEINHYRALVYGGLGGLNITRSILDSIDLLVQSPADFAVKDLHFDGLITGRLTAENSLERLLQADVDVFVIKDSLEHAFTKLQDALYTGTLSMDALDGKVRKILQAKYWQNGGRFSKKPQEKSVQVLQASLKNDPEGEAPPKCGEDPEKEKVLTHFKANQWGNIARSLQEEAIILASNKDNILPVKDIYRRGFRLIQYGALPMLKFKASFGKYANFFSELEKVKKKEPLPALKRHRSKRWINIITLEDLALEEKRDSAFIRSVLEIAKEDKLVLINFGDPNNLRFFDTSLTIIQIFDHNPVTESLAAQLIFGGIEAKGKFPYTINEYFVEGGGIKTPITRLKYGFPEEVGISPEKLVGIDAIARTAIENGAMPGCQVLVAKNGNVIYNKSFGYHTYNKRQKVQNKDLYDLASITKVAATTLGTMKLYEQKKLSLKDKIKDHLECGENSTIKYIPVKKLLTHGSGLPPSMPIAPYLLYRDQPNAGCDSFFCKEATESYNVKIANNFYFNGGYQDSIWKKVYKTNFRGPRRYRYSDVNFMLLQKIVETRTGERMDSWLNKTVYAPLGLRRSLFNPLSQFKPKQIVPTQNDGRWRQQLVRGYVHDEAAALQGGVGGNAGLFSNTEDLAVLFQMLLNKGKYGGKRYFEEETVQLFTNTYHGNHRGLGFDKPTRGSRSAYSKSASAQTFGHTGFTGTCVWVDPQHDLVYIFLSNRIYPRTSNRLLFKAQVRERIHQVVYDALDTFKGTLPPLDGKPVQRT